MNRDYKGFINELKEMAQEGVKAEVDKMNDREKTMLPVIDIYYQQKLAKWTLYLVLATLGVAVAAVIVAFIT